MLKRILVGSFVTFSLSGCGLIQDQLDGNQAPVVSDLVAEPAEGEAPLLVSFSWEVTDREEDTLSCALVYGDDQQRVENCGEVTNTFHTFGEPGGYAVVLEVKDGVNSAARSVPVRVLEPEIK